MVRNIYASTPSRTQLIEFVYLAAVAYGLVCDLDLIPKLVSLYELFGPCDLVAVATKVEALVILVWLQGLGQRKRWPTLRSVPNSGWQQRGVPTPDIRPQKPTATTPAPLCR